MKTEAYKTYTTQVTTAVAGIVRTHAATISRTTPHLTADEYPRVAPAPMIAPVIACVVETGTPRDVITESTKPPAIEAEKP